MEEGRVVKGCERGRDCGGLRRVAGNMEESRVAGNMGKVGKCSGKCGGRLERFVESME